MTERDKIIKIIADNRNCFLYAKRCDMCEYKSKKNSRLLCTMYKLADELIETGIGDVTEAEHRAEVMERALLWLCDTAMRNVLVMAFPSTKTQVRNKQELYDYCIAQAEKELAGEQK